MTRINSRKTKSFLQIGLIKNSKKLVIVNSMLQKFVFKICNTFTLYYKKNLITYLHLLQKQPLLNANEKYIHKLNSDYNVLNRNGFTKV